MSAEPPSTPEAGSPPAWIAIAPMRIELLESYNQCLGSVARERKYLMLTDAPPLEDSRDFVQYILAKKFPMMVAIIPGPTVVGWCDICPQRYESRSHVGVLGIGICAEYRGQGLGRLLMERALKRARACFLERIELDVYSSNTRAFNLYKALEFEQEGVKRRARKIDGVYEDIIIMAKYF